MPRYVVNHRYASGQAHDRLGPWERGQVLELGTDLAARVNVDSPGCLSEAPPAEPVQPPVEAELSEEPMAEPAVEDESERAKLPAKDRQHRGGRNRSI